MDTVIFAADLIAYAFVEVKYRIVKYWGSKYQPFLLMKIILILLRNLYIRYVVMPCDQII